MLTPSASTYLACNESIPETSGNAIAACYDQNRGKKPRSNRWTIGEQLAADRLDADFKVAENRYGVDPDDTELQKARIDAEDGDDTSDLDGWSIVADLVPAAESIRAPFIDPHAIQMRALKRCLVVEDLKRALAAVNVVAAGYGKLLARYVLGTASVPTLAAELGCCEDTVRKALKLAVGALREHYSAISRAPITLPPARGEPAFEQCYSQTGPSLNGRLRLSTIELQ